MRTIFLVSLLFCAHCTGAPAQDTDFLGTWEWYTTEYRDGTVDHPGTVGYNEQLHFTGERGFVRYRDGQVFQAGEWYLSEILVGACFVYVLGTGFLDSWVPWVWLDEVEFMTLQTGFQCPGGEGEPPLKTAYFFRRGPVSSGSQSWGTLKSTYK